jgi:UDP-N-acetylmuramate: L-alanyl-gamma-D-glutamyl-meso-diaminopimelate ligase
MIIEGDEYPDAAINKIPKFHIYRPDVALLKRIAWVTLMSFPTFEELPGAIRIFIELISEEECLIL